MISTTLFSKRLNSLRPVVAPLVSMAMAFSFHYGLMLSARAYYDWAKCDYPTMFGSLICEYANTVRESQRAQLVSFTNQWLRTSMDIIAVVKLSELIGTRK